MRPIHKKSLPIVFFIASLIIFLLASYSSAEVMKMSKEELKSLMEKNQNILIIDVRGGKDWSSSEFKIQGAKRADPSNFSSWSTVFPKDNTLVLYCA